MGKKKTIRENGITIHSAAAEYLTFVAASGNATDSFEIRYQDENIWLTQKMMAALYGVSVPAISQHIKRIYDEGELVPETTVKKYLTVQTESGIKKTRNAVHRHTAAGLIYERADAGKDHMGLTTWENAKMERF